MGQHRSTATTSLRSSEQLDGSGKDGGNSGAGSLWHDRQGAIATVECDQPGAAGRRRRQDTGTEAGSNRRREQFRRRDGPSSRAPGSLSATAIERELQGIAV